MGEHFCSNLRRARIASGLSQKDLAEKIGVAKSTYSLYESGKREPGIEIIRRLTLALDISAETLLGIDRDANTLASRFEGQSYTSEEIEEIVNFADYLKSKRK